MASTLNHLLKRPLSLVNIVRFPAFLWTVNFSFIEPMYCCSVLWGRMRCSHSSPLCPTQWMVVSSRSVVTVGHNAQRVLKTFPYFHIACGAFPHCTAYQETIIWALSLRVSRIPFEMSYMWFSTALLTAISCNRGHAAIFLNAWGTP